MKHISGQREKLATLRKKEEDMNTRNLSQTKESNETVTGSLAKERIIESQHLLLKEAIDKVHRNMSILEEISRHNLLSLLSGIETAKSSGYNRGMEVMASEMKQLALLSRKLLDALDNKPAEAGKENIHLTHEFLERHKH